MVGGTNRAGRGRNGGQAIGLRRLRAQRLVQPRSNAVAASTCASSTAPNTRCRRISNVSAHAACRPKPPGLAGICPGHRRAGALHPPEPLRRVHDASSASWPWKANRWIRGCERASSPSGPVSGGKTQDSQDTPGIAATETRAFVPMLAYVQSGVARLRQSAFTSAQILAVIEDTVRVLAEHPFWRARWVAEGEYEGWIRP